ncbi:hypothetical protein [Stigmatella hybrida]|uniref:hypothetical protein n=1 Tax=Stigmatella hybrida TaxID=394097 RepID=UPI001CDA6CD8|nr:hypothetical protein [Stigmatella hybrida]
MAPDTQGAPRESKRPGATPGEALAAEAQAPKRQCMNLLVILLVLALLFGGVGLFVEGLKWLLIISAALFVASLVSGAMGRGRLRA